MTDVCLIYGVAEWKTMPMSTELDSAYRRGYWYLIREPVFDNSIEKRDLYRFQNVILAGVMHEVVSVKYKRYKIQQICLEGSPLLEMSKSFSTDDSDRIERYEKYITECAAGFNDFIFEPFRIAQIVQMSIIKINSMNKELKNESIRSN